MKHVRTNDIQQYMNLKVRRRQTGQHMSYAWFFTICTHGHRLRVKRDIVPPYLH